MVVSTLLFLPIFASESGYPGPRIKDLASEILQKNNLSQKLEISWSQDPSIFDDSEQHWIGIHFHDFGGPGRGLEIQWIFMAALTHPQIRRPSVGNAMVLEPQTPMTRDLGLYRHFDSQTRHQNKLEHWNRRIYLIKKFILAIIKKFVKLENVLEVAESHSLQEVSQFWSEVGCSNRAPLGVQ